jgi:hypothetical protein
MLDAPHTDGKIVAIEEPDRGSPEAQLGFGDSVRIHAERIERELEPVDGVADLLVDTHRRRR